MRLRYKELAHLHEAIALQIHYYNTKRIHSALKMSPAAYTARLKDQESSERVLQKVRGCHVMHKIALDDFTILLDG